MSVCGFSKALALGIFTNFPVMAQQLPAETLGSPAYVSPAVDCRSPKLQALDAHQTFRIVRAPFEYTKADNTTTPNLCLVSRIPCLVFDLTTGQKVFLAVMGMPLVLDGSPLQLTTGQSQQLTKVGYSIILRCQEAMMKQKGQPLK